MLTTAILFKKNLFLFDTATWPVSSQAEPANWLAGCVVSLVSNFIRPSRAEPWNEVETFCQMNCQMNKSSICVR